MKKLILWLRTQCIISRYVLKQGRKFMTRVIHGPKDRVIPFDLRNKTRMVDAVLFAYYYGRLRKKTGLEKFFRDFFRIFR